MDPKQRRAFRIMLAFFFVSGLLLLAGAAYAWNDEHGGIAGTAHVTHCQKNRVRSTSVHCDATWTYNGRPATGYVENAKFNQAGKTISVRIHGTSHVTNTTYWVPIGLALFAVLEFAVFVMILRQYRRKLQAT